MKNHQVFKILASLPVILIALYFIPFLGICLIIWRGFIYSYRDQKDFSISFILISIGIIILIPKGFSLLFHIINLDSLDIPYYHDLLNSEIYNVDCIKYSKLLLTVGTLFLIISFIFRNLLNKLQNGMKSYLMNQEKRDAEISQKNDLIMKEKRENAKNTSVVYCPYCGADNMLTSHVGICKYCRRKIQAKK